LEYLSDGSVQTLLILMGFVLSLFGAYLLVVFLSNRSLRRLADRHRGGRDQPAHPPARLYSRARWVILIMLGVMGGLFGLLILITRLTP